MAAECGNTASTAPSKNKGIVDVWKGVGGVKGRKGRAKKKRGDEIEYGRIHGKLEGFSLKRTVGRKRMKSTLSIVTHESSFP